MNDILSTLYKFIYATLIKVSMLTREKMLQARFECLNQNKICILAKCCYVFCVIHFETLPPNQTITAQSYCDQLDRLNEMLKEKRSSLVVSFFIIITLDPIVQGSRAIRLRSLVGKNFCILRILPILLLQIIINSEVCNISLMEKNTFHAWHSKRIFNTLSLVSMLTFIRVA